MSIEVTLAGESECAEVTYIWLFTGMGSHVNH